MIIEEQGDVIEDNTNEPATTEAAGNEEFQLGDQSAPEDDRDASRILSYTNQVNSLKTVTLRLISSVT